MECLSCCEKVDSISLKNIKLVVVDLDGTLYDLSRIIRRIYELQVDFFSSEKKMSKERVTELFKDNCIFPYVTKESKSATEFFLQSGIDNKRWTRCRNEYDYIMDIVPEKTINQELISMLKLNYKVILLSSNTLQNVFRTLEKIAINKDVFDKIICSNENKNAFQKDNCLREYCLYQKINTDEVLSIGDRYQTDIMPLVKLGAIGVWLKKPKFFSSLTKDIMSLCLRSGEEYEVYI